MCEESFHRLMILVLKAVISVTSRRWKSARVGPCFFRPFGAGQPWRVRVTHGLRRGLYSFAAPRLGRRTREPNP